MTQTFRVVNEGINAWTGRTIQQALDQASSNGGGVVTVPAGTYLLDNAVRLRSGVHLIGETGDCRQVFGELLKRGVIVRTGDIFGCPNHIRVTTGTDAQNQRFLDALTEVLNQ